MLVLEILFWALFASVFYAYLGYGLVLFILVKIKKLVNPYQPKMTDDFEPDVTLFVAAYNEKDYVDAKVQNGFEMDYPREKNLSAMGDRWLG